MISWFSEVNQITSRIVFSLPVLQNCIPGQNTVKAGVMIHDKIISPMMVAPKRNGHSDVGSGYTFWRVWGGTTDSTNWIQFPLNPPEAEVEREEEAG